MMIFSDYHLLSISVGKHPTKYFLWQNTVLFLTQQTHLLLMLRLKNNHPLKIGTSWAIFHRTSLALDTYWWFCWFLLREGVVDIVPKCHDSVHEWWYALCWIPFPFDLYLTGKGTSFHLLSLSIEHLHSTNLAPFVEDRDKVDQEWILYCIACIDGTRFGKRVDNFLSWSLRLTSGRLKTHRMKSKIWINKCMILLSSLQIWS